MDFFTPKYRRNPNEMVSSIYSGVAPGGRTVTTVVKPSVDRNSMEATRVYGPGLPRGQGGHIGVLVLGGMVTTLAEMEYIIEAKKDKKFMPQRTGGEIADMCRLLIEQRNERIRDARRMVRANPSMQPKQPKRKMRLLLPVGCRFVPTSTPGLEVVARR